MDSSRTYIISYTHYTHTHMRYTLYIVHYNPFETSRTHTEFAVWGLYLYGGYCSPGKIVVCRAAFVYDVQTPTNRRRAGTTALVIANMPCTKTERREKTTYFFNRNPVCLKDDRVWFSDFELNSILCTIYLNGVLYNDNIIYCLQ